MPRYFKTDSRKVTFSEYWNLTRSPAVLLPWVFKLFSIPLPLPGGIPEPGPFREAIIAREGIPPDILATFEPWLQECRQGDFNTVWYYTLKDSLLSARAYAIELLHDSGEMIGKIIYSALGHCKVVAVVFLSATDDGKVIATTNKKPDLSAPPHFEAERMFGARAGKLLQRHLERLAAVKSAGSVIRFKSFEDVALLEDRMGKLLVDYHVGRGVWIEMTPQEIVAAGGRPPPSPAG